MFTCNLCAFSLFISRLPNLLMKYIFILLISNQINSYLIAPYSVDLSNLRLYSYIKNETKIIDI